jgi:serine/threonine protein kinase/tetratricopeptide (TPR) repeat protein
MTPERYQQIREVLVSAVACPLERRPIFLAEACAGDESLLQEIESLLEHEQPAKEFIEESAFAVASRVLSDSSEALISSQVGPYRIASEIGRGGMGVVYVAVRDDEHFAKRVAIKVVKRGMDTELVLRRFRNERQILANLEHPNIARIIDGGVTEGGLPYFVMEYVDGKPIDVYCDDKRLSIDERLELFREVCSAVQFAHQNLVIHRDIKPDNILVTNEGVPKLLDFGIAKLLHPDSLESATEATVTGLRMMTPEYASPEQARGDRITTATDIYSLGVLLYQLLTGHRPYQFKDKALLEVARVICEKAPEQPSTAISRIEEVSAAGGKPAIRLTPESVSRTREGEPEKLRRRLAGDLDNIVLMAMRKEPERRYSSVAQFAEDLRRHLAGLPVLASTDTFWYRSAKFVRRHKTGAAAATLVVLSLFGGIIATAWQARIATRQRNAAQIEKARAERINEFLQDMLGSADPSWYTNNPRRGGEVTVAEMLDEEAERADHELADQPAVLAAVQRTIGNTYRYQGRFDLAERELRTALATEQRLYGPAHPEVARSSDLLAGVFMVKGEYDKAESLLRQAVEIYRDPRAGGDAPPVWHMSALGDLGLLLSARGDSAGAEGVLREALRLAPKLTGNERALIPLLLANLGRARESQGDLSEAETLYRQSTVEYRRLSGRERLELATSLTYLGDLLMTEGKLSESELVLAEALDIARRLAGEDNLNFFHTLKSFGQLLYLKGEYAAAEEQIDRSLEFLRRTMPAGHLAFASPLTTLGLIMNRTGRPALAEKNLREALAIRTRVLPKGHLLIALTEGGLGECLLTQERYAEAEPLLKESYGDLTTSQGAKNPRTLEARQRLAQLYQSWGKPELAVQFGPVP